MAFEIPPYITTSLYFLYSVCKFLNATNDLFTKLPINTRRYLVTLEYQLCQLFQLMLASLQALWAPTHMLRQENAQRPQTDALAARVDTIIVEI